MKPTSEYFDLLFEGNDDPWEFRSRWYESRKRALTLASLPLARYANCYEPGCANGELSAGLAERCDRLLASDGSLHAVRLSTERLAGLSHVRIRQERVPFQWPDETFDLIVISEFAYYLSPTELGLLIERTLKSIRAGGTVLACHWRRNISGCALNGDEIHQRFNEYLSLPRLTQLVEQDFRLDVWCHDARSLAQRDGLA